MSTEPLFAGASAAEPKSEPIYKDNKFSNNKGVLIGLSGFLAVVLVNVIVTIILTSIQAAKRTGLFVLLLVSFLLCAQVEAFLVFFVFRGYLPRRHIWSLFAVGVCVIIEAILTDVIVYQVHTY